MKIKFATPVIPLLAFGSTSEFMEFPNNQITCNPEGITIERLEGAAVTVPWAQIHFISRTALERTTLPQVERKEDMNDKVRPRRK